MSRSPKTSRWAAFRAGVASVGDGLASIGDGFASLGRAFASPDARRRDWERGRSQFSRRADARNRELFGSPLPRYDPSVTVAQALRGDMDRLRGDSDRAMQHLPSLDELRAAAAAQNAAASTDTTTPDAEQPAPPREPS